MRQTRALILFEFPPAKDRSGEDGSAERKQWDAAARALLLDSIERFARLPFAQTFVFPRDPSIAAEISAVDSEVEIRRQDGDAPWEQCAGAIVDIFDEGFRHVLLLSTRVPAVPQSSIERGFSLLDMFDDSIVLAPTTQGGYYGVGLRHPEPSLFSGIDLQSPTLFEDTMHRIDPERTAVYLLMSWPDVASADDLHRLALELRDPLPEHRYLRRTAGVLSDLPPSPRHRRDPA